MTTISSHLKFDGLVNARHLGGYGAGEKRTRSTSYVRCENPGRVSEKDRDTLYDFGVRQVIDLRSPEEVEREPDLLAEDSRFLYTLLPVFSSDTSPAALAQGDIDMGALYIHMLEDCKATFQKVLRLILETEGGVLFHCTAGKDRTGVLAALLLLSAGVSEADVVEEYAYTAQLLRPLAEELKKNIPAGPDRSRAEEMLAADPAYIEAAIRHLNTGYSGAAGYLLSLGFSEDEINALNARLV